jgi:energy-coupling factor transporter ATP-binding protein EcfA2
MPTLIGLSGKKGVGKSTVANIFKGLGYKEKSFALPLKKTLSHMLGVDVDEFESPTTKDSLYHCPMILKRELIIDALLFLSENYIQIPTEVIKKTADNCANVELHSHRELMQYFGTEVVREHINPMYWINVMDSQISTEIGPFVITDARFPDERQYVKSKLGKTGIVIRETESEDTHKSETQMGELDNYDLVFYNNGTIAQLQHEIELWDTLGVR